MNILLNGGLIRDLRESYTNENGKTGISRDRLAKELDVSHNIIRAWEKQGGIFPRSDSLYRLAKFFDVEMESLITEI